MGVTRSAAQSFRLVLGAGVFQRAFGFAALAVIARHIGEGEFGIFRQMVTLHLAAGVMLPLGFDQLVIRERHERRAMTEALAASCLLMYVVLAVAAVAAAVFCAAGPDGLEPYAPLLAAAPVILVFQALRMSRKSVLTANLQFGRITSAEAANTIISLGGGGVALVLWERGGAGVLYAALAAGELAEAWILRQGAPQLPKPAAAWSRFRELFAQHRPFCLMVTADQTLSIVSTGAPVLLLGALIGTAAAGTFAMANFLVLPPLLLLLGAVNRVAYPVLASREEAALREGILRLTRATAAATPAPLIWLAVMAPTAAPLFLGAKWSGESAAIIPWLALYAIPVGIFSPLGSLDILRNRLDIGLAWNVTTLTARVGALVIGSQWGLVPAAAAFALASCAMWAVNGVILGVLARTGARAFHGSYLRYAPLWLALAAAIAAVEHLVPAPALVRLALSLVPLAAYAGALAWLDPAVTAQLLRLARVTPRTPSEGAGGHS